MGRVVVAGLAALSLLGSFGCGESERVKARQSGEQLCPPAVNPGAGTGKLCSDALECQEYCCECQGGVKGYGASACIADACGDQTSTCAAALKQQPGLCP